MADKVAGVVPVRDSKVPGSAVLVIGPAVWAEFIRTLGAARFQAGVVLPRSASRALRRRTGPCPPRRPPAPVRTRGPSSGPARPVRPAFAPRWPEAESGVGVVARGHQLTGGVGEPVRGAAEHQPGQCLSGVAASYGVVPFIRVRVACGPSPGSGISGRRRIGIIPRPTANGATSGG
ncbi:DUF397 domain-containing protein [Streptomyces sp. NPDC052107]|uniref:DUF397 domain-containing protein n=1 Tax=Streptomyces sp. NPDC052107 TaxID=3155632 RepID=UPI003416EBFE